MKKLFLLSAAILAVQTLPVLAQDGPPPHEGGKHHGKGMERMFEKQDTDKDGVITEAEFNAFTKKRFDDMDANKDGKVTKEEAKAHHDAMKAKWKERREKSKDAPVEAPKE